MFPPLLAVALAWDAVTGANPPVQGYRLYYGPNPGAQTTFKQVDNVTTGEITGLPRVCPFISYAGRSTGQRRSALQQCLD
jgi:hypothetical protein